VIGLDANVLVRLIAGDDHAQERAVLRLLTDGKSTFFVSDVTLAEVAWVLDRIYEFTREELASAIEALTGREDLVFEDTIRVQRALRHLVEGGDFTDFLILARAESAGCTALASFDKALKKRFPDFVAVPS
jgi:predicted nucleic-acid-binding protein